MNIFTSLASGVLKLCSYFVFAGITAPVLVFLLGLTIHSNVGLKIESIAYREDVEKLTATIEQMDFENKNFGTE